MDLSDVQEKLYPQKIILDININTVTGEPVPAGTEICVYFGRQDPNHYTPGDLIDNFPLPRQVKIIDESLYRLGKSCICSKELNLQSVTTNYFLLFTTELKDGPLVSGLELRHHVKCCVFTDLREVKIRTRIDNSQFSDTFSTIFLFEKIQDNQMVFSVLGRHSTVSRSKAGRLEYKDQDSGFSDSDLESCVSTLAVGKSKTSNIKHISEGNKTLPKKTKPRRIRRLSTQNNEIQNYIRQISDVTNTPKQTKPRRIPILSTQDDFFKNSTDDSDITSNCSSGEYVGVRLDIEKTANIQHISEHNNTPPKQNKQRRIRRLSTQDDFSKNSIDDSDTTSGRSSGEYVDVKFDIEKIPPIPERTYLNPPIVQKDHQSKYDTYIASTEHLKAGEGANVKLETNINKSEKISVSTSKRDIRSITIIQLGILLKNFKLYKFAEICCENQIDGDFFMDMTAEILKQEPFNLNSFEMLKVTKLQSGWNPK
ncbi:Hypothetical predicted protein [Mytilus galloprovincialis]|uniref:CABIT domain-containing protein n=1 Tax=Mytilus galloprovincialis TaxID=29158 RepID=A0A8B6FXJ5_MYTGA|nr:Hypothetical predicted protein [Mytilus galloprovincialis]